MTDSRVSQVRPAVAVAEVSRAFGVSADQAKLAICQRASHLLLVALAERVDGFSPPDVIRMPTGTATQPVWPWFWRTAVARDPQCLIWSVGDVEFGWANYPGTSLYLCNVTFQRSQLAAMIADGGTSANDNRANFSVEPSSKPVALTKATKWDWEGVLAELAALASLPDGLETITGFQPIVNGQVPRGNLARLEQWIADALAAKGQHPTESEVRIRARKVIQAIQASASKRKRLEQP